MRSLSSSNQSFGFIIGRSFLKARQEFASITRAFLDIRRVIGEIFFQWRGYLDQDCVTIGNYCVSYKGNPCALLWLSGALFLLHYATCASSLAPGPERAHPSTNFSCAPAKQRRENNWQKEAASLIPYVCDPDQSLPGHKVFIIYRSFVHIICEGNSRVPSHHIQHAPHECSISGQIECYHNQDGREEQEYYRQPVFSTVT